MARSSRYSVYVLGWLGLAVVLLSLTAHADGAAPLVLQAKIPLGPVVGRIDHMAVDLHHGRLFVAELGNNSVAVVDLDSRRVLRRIGGLSEPQGVGYEPTADMIYVANAGDGSVRLFRGDDLVAAGRIELGSDADNVRIFAGQVLIGHGDGAIAVIDAASRRTIADIRLPAHPESFRVTSNRIFVNLPDARQIAVIDRARRQRVALWRFGGARANFPMALDRGGARVITAFRDPPTLVVFDSRRGMVVAHHPVCGDADDVFVDTKRRLVYVSCGAGFIDIFAAADKYAVRGRVATIPGARTALFVPERDRLYLAVRAARGQGAAIWVFKPLP